MYKIFIALGVTFIVIGVILYLFKDLSLFKLPGDIIIQKENFSFYFPITTSILLSIIISIIVYTISTLYK